MTTSPIPIHPDRDAILSELHARPIDLVDAGLRVRRIVAIVEARVGVMRAVMERFAEFAAAEGHHLDDPTARQLTFNTAAGRRVTWEFHAEFVTVTWTAPLSDEQNWPADIGLAVLDNARLIGGVRVDVIEDRELAQGLIESFAPQSLCAASVEAGKAQVVTDFVPDAEGFIRFEFASGGLTTFRRSITLRRLLEIETYRTMALMALPAARAASPTLRALETDLEALIENLEAAESIEDVRERLAGLHALSVRTGQMSERLGYRFAAAKAYGAILHSRLDKLRETALQGSSITSFVANRVDPALETYQAINKRISVLSKKIERGIELLNLRIGLDMQTQNSAVLETIASTAQSQFRLQRTVEGLSTIAITYYLLGIIGYALGAPIYELGWDKTWVLSIIAPFALFGVWLAMRSIRKRAH